MGRIVVFNSLTLDGVMQAPGGPDEDRRDDFEYGGWARPYFDPVMAQVAGEGMANESGMLFGRRTYEQFASFWPHQPDEDPFAAILNRRQKFVVSRTLSEPLPWSNSTLLHGDAADALSVLKATHDMDLVILGSGELIRSLMRRNLIDAFTLLIHPLILGSGRRLFTGDGDYAALRLVNTTTSRTGVLIATYELA
jgi:dihydrofolate reductase